MRHLILLFIFLLSLSFHALTQTPIIALKMHHGHLSDLDMDVVDKVGLSPYMEELWEKRQDSLNKVVEIDTLILQPNGLAYQINQYPHRSFIEFESLPDLSKSQSTRYGSFIRTDLEQKHNYYLFKGQHFSFIGQGAHFPLPPKTTASPKIQKEKKSALKPSQVIKQQLSTQPVQDTLKYEDDQILPPAIHTPAPPKGGNFPLWALTLTLAFGLLISLTVWQNIRKSWSFDS